jgi:hypothetical protein
MRRIAVVLFAVATFLAPSNARADDRPETEHLILAGAGMAVPTYFLGVILHEGSHAVAARSFGATITRFQILPGRHPKTGVFYFGYAGWRGKLTRSELVFTLLAPKLTDALMIGGYTALWATDNLPDNAYGGLALAVLATGFWVDFTKDLFLHFRPTNDVTRVFHQYGRKSFWSQLPGRLVYAGLSAAGAYVVLRGYEKVFSDEDDPTRAMFLLPLAQGRF